jgi:hypothetical protein
MTLPWSRPIIPEKPDNPDEQFDMLWDMCFNHIPSWLAALNWKLNTVMILLAVIVGMCAFRF